MQEPSCPSGAALKAQPSPFSKLRANFQHCHSSLEKHELTPDLAFFYFFPKKLGKAQLPAQELARLGGTGRWAWQVGALL